MIIFNKATNKIYTTCMCVLSVNSERVHTAVLADGHKSSSYVEKIDINCWEKLEDISFVFYSETCLNQMSF